MCRITNRDHYSICHTVGEPGEPAPKSEDRLRSPRIGLSTSLHSCPKSGSRCQTSCRTHYRCHCSSRRPNKRPCWTSRRWYRWRYWSRRCLGHSSLDTRSDELDCVRHVILVVQISRRHGERTGTYATTSCADGDDSVRISWLACRKKKCKMSKSGTRSSGDKSGILPYSCAFQVFPNSTTPCVRALT